MNWRNLLFRRLGWKLFSLLTAFVIWSTFQLNDGSLFGWNFEAMRETQTRDFLGFPVRIVTDPDDNSRYRLQPSRVDLTFTGPTRAIDPLKVQDIQVFIDVQNLKTAERGTNRIQVRHPAGTELVQIDPATVAVERLPRESRPLVATNPPPATF